VFAARSDNGVQWVLWFQPARGNAASSVEFHAALLGFLLAPDVKAGENRGRKLQHDLVVLVLNNAASTEDGDAQQSVLSVTSEFVVVPKHLSLVVWVTLARSPQPVQSLGGWLPAPEREP
jgi:hypothetical protein